MHREVAPNSLRKTNADTVLSVICWLFDMNYHYSIFYCKKLNLFAGFCSILEKINVDREKIEIVRQVMKDYVLNNFQIQI